MRAPVADIEQRSREQTSVCGQMPTARHEKPKKVDASLEVLMQIFLVHCSCPSHLFWEILGW